MASRDRPEQETSRAPAFQPLGDLESEVGGVREDSAAQVAARRAALVALSEDQVPFVVAGAYALREYTGIFRDTKDLDLFCLRADAGRALGSLFRVGFRV